MRALRYALLVLPLAAGCGPKTVYTDADVPKLQKIDDVMWAQAQAMDPLFKKIGQASFSDEELAALSSGGNRLSLTTARLKESFSKGPEFNQLADELAKHGAALVEAATNRDAQKASAALASAKATCKACHAKFR